MCGTCAANYNGDPLALHASFFASFCQCPHRLEVLPMNLRTARLALIAAALPWLLADAPAFAQEPAAATRLSLAPIFSSHMVLQRDVKNPIWGKAAPDAKVKLQIADETKEATANKDGKWSLTVGPLEAGRPLELVVTSGDETVKLDDVLVGEVWIASGQSNMEWPVTASLDPEKEIAAAKYPQIRFIDVPNKSADEPAGSFESTGWQVCTPETIGNFSAVAYFFGRELHKELNVPIGLIGANWGGTPMEAWTSREALESSDTFKPIVEAAQAPPKSPEEVEQRKKMAAHQPAALFNGMLAPVIPYGIRGALWYQGESNADRHQQYAELSKLMITDWRNRWGQAEFPFLLVQLAAYEKGGETWPPLRAAQLETLELPNTGMATAIDIGDRTDIHPKNKQEVARRLALAARRIAYGQDIVYSGPVYREMHPADAAVRLFFDHVGGGLKSEGELRGFEIAGEDGKFVPAQAKIDGEQVVVSSEAVAKPQAVRYSWAAFPEGNLYNAEGLPAVPFRTTKEPEKSVVDDAN